MLHRRYVRQQLMWFAFVDIWLYAASHNGGIWNTRRWNKGAFQEYIIAELEQCFVNTFWTVYKEGVPLIQKIYLQLINFALDRKTVKLIGDSYPDKTLRRRSCGYVIDEVIENLTDESKLLREFGIRKFKKE